MGSKAIKSSDWEEIIILKPSVPLLLSLSPLIPNRLNLSFQKKTGKERNVAEKRLSIYLVLKKICVAMKKKKVISLWIEVKERLWACQRLHCLLTQLRRSGFDSLVGWLCILDPLIHLLCWMQSISSSLACRREGESHWEWAWNGPAARSPSFETVPNQPRDFLISSQTAPVSLNWIETCIKRFTHRHSRSTYLHVCTRLGKYLV